MICEVQCYDAAHLGFGVLVVYGVPYLAKTSTACAVNELKLVDQSFVLMFVAKRVLS